MVKTPAIYRLSPICHFWHFLCDFCNFWDNQYSSKNLSYCPINRFLESVTSLVVHLFRITPCQLLKSASILGPPSCPFRFLTNISLSATESTCKHKSRTLVSHTPLLSGGASLMTSSSNTLLTSSCAPCIAALLPFNLHACGGRFLHVEEGFCSLSAEADMLYRPFSSPTSCTSLVLGSSAVSGSSSTLSPPSLHTVVSPLPAPSGLPLPGCGTSQ
jgi:hypothetical protein